LLLLLAVQVALSLWYMAQAFGRVAPYGDARTEYLTSVFLEKGMHPIRGSIYPLVVHGWRQTGLPLGALHLVQLAALLAGLQFFVRHLSARAGFPATAGWRGALVAASLTLLTGPLLVHFGMAVMPDALATSLLLWTVWVVVEALESASRAPGRWRGLAILALAGLLSSLVRKEHAYLLAGFSAVIAGIFLTAARRRDTRIRVAAALAVVLVAAAGSLVLTATIKNRFPTPERNNPKGLWLASRLSYGGFDRIHPHLSEGTRRLLPPPKVLNNHPHEFLLRVRELRLAGAPPAVLDRLVNEVSMAALRHDAQGILVRVVYDWGRYAFPDASFPANVSDGRGGSGNLSNWVFSRMVEQTGTPDRTRPWIRGWILGQGLLCAGLLAAWFVASWKRAYRPTPAAVCATLVFLGSFAAFYAAAIPNFAVRYALPAFAVGHAALVTTAVALLTSRAAGPGDGPG
jgi:hypothetical protein